MKFVLNHLASPLMDEDELAERIEKYLKKNGFHYAMNDPDLSFMNGIIVWVPDIGDSDYPSKNEEITKLSDLSTFLLDTLQLDRKCLHFSFKEHIINGEGVFEVRVDYLNKTAFEELTGEVLPSEIREKTFRFS